MPGIRSLPVAVLKIVLVGVYHSDLRPALGLGTAQQAAGSEGRGGRPRPSGCHSARSAWNRDQFHRMDALRGSNGFNVIVDATSSMPASPRANVSALECTE